MTRKRDNIEDFIWYKEEYKKFIKEDYTYEDYLKEQNKEYKQTKISEKIFMLLIIFLTIATLNSFTIYLSGLYWEKAFRAVNENKYEAIVVGHKKEKHTSNERKERIFYYVYFPEVKYINNQGEEVVKLLDIGSNNPWEIGETIKISDDKNQITANSMDINGMFFGFTLFLFVISFLAYFISSYITNHNIKKRMKGAIYFGLFVMISNIISIIVKIYA